MLYLNNFTNGPMRIEITGRSLFNCVGRILRSTNEQLAKDLKDRIIAFFDWRFEVEEPTELATVYLLDASQVPRC